MSDDTVNWYHENAVNEIKAESATQLLRLQNEIKELSIEVKRLEQYETYYRLAKGLRE